MGCMENVGRLLGADDMQPRFGRLLLYLVIYLVVKSQSICTAGYFSAITRA